MSGFKFNKELSVGHILTSLTMLASVFFAYTTLEKRVTVLESSVVIHKDGLNEFKTEIRSDLTRIETKLDRVIMGSVQ